MKAHVMPGRWQVVLLGLIFSLSLPGAAQEFSDPADLIADVLRTHPAVRRAQFSLDSARAILGGSRALPNPTLTLAATAGDAGEDSNILNQTFEISGQPRLRQEQAQARVEAAQLQLRSVRRQIASQAYHAWLALWENHHLARLAQVRMDLTSEMTRVAHRRYEVGEIPQNESLRAELASAEAESALARALAEYQAAARSLQILRQETRVEPADLLANSELIPVSRPGGPSLSPVDTPWTLENTLIAADQQLELASQRQEHKALLIGSELAGKERAPQLGVSLYTSRFTGSSIEQGAQLYLSVPLWDWGRVSSAKTAQLAQAQAQLAEVEEKALSLRRQVAELWNRWRAAHTVCDLLTSQAGRYQELARESRIGYDLGLLSLTDVLQTETAFHQAAVELIQAQALIRRLELELLERTNLPWPSQLLEES